MRIAIKDLRLERLVVLYPGAIRFPLADKVAAVPLRELAAGFRLTMPKRFSSAGSATRSNRSAFRQIAPEE
jgi:hypothetical protein